MTDHTPHWSKDVEYVNPMTVFPTYVRGELVQVVRTPTLEQLEIGITNAKIDYTKRNALIQAWREWCKRAGQGTGDP